MSVRDVSAQLSEPGAGSCPWCHATIERYRTVGNQHDVGRPSLAAFEPSAGGAWGLELDGVMHRRQATPRVNASPRYAVHICPGGED